ncbi:hypothetical protein [Ilumatobacter nonamiensis]|uniref:hypothetical protein n=1 Tax=Ilumatobacter nonamiensis TaxID=467093 RepID=UPI000348434B|nr:hypothetical protein [Ilumatobacter nonamiensis]
MTTASLTALDAGITLGSTGQRPRWTLSPWGSVTPWGEADPVSLDWYIAADDRWHVPAQEPTVRQERIEGTPVVETRLRVPDGDAVQRVWAVPEGGGSVIVEFENESPMPFAVALTGPTVVTERPPADVPIQGIDLDDAIVLPVGHRSIVRVALAHAAGVIGPKDLGRVPPAMAVVRGWTSTVERASRLVLPDERLVGAVVAARCDLLLEGPVDADQDAAGFLLDVAELVRCGDDAGAWLPDVVESAGQLARAAAKRGADPATVAESLQALGAARVVARHARDELAAADIDRTIERVRSKRSDVDPATGVIASFADVRRTQSVGRFVRSVERRIADGGRLLTGGIPNSWLGSNFEVHAVPTSPSTAASFAVRWHGERPAVLWEQQGDAPVELSAPDVDPDWHTTESSGEALWVAPRPARAATSPLSITIDSDPDPGASFV